MPGIDVWDLYQSMYQSSGAEVRGRLLGWQLEIFALCELRQEVGSDGFMGYFYYEYGDTAPVALRALPGILGTDWADVLRQAMSLLGRDYPMNKLARQDCIDSGLEMEEQFNQLDERLYALERTTDADAHMNNFVRRHIEIRQSVNARSLFRRWRPK